MEGQLLQLQEGGKVTKCPASFSHSIQVFHVASSYLFFVSLVLPPDKENTKKVKMYRVLYDFNNFLLAKFRHLSID
jgi:hypothetical protein